MSTNTKIEWTDATWNPTTGCDKVSPGCDHCYAERMAYRLAHIQGSGYEGDYAHDYPGIGFEVRLHPNRLEQPFHWRKPRRIFVCSMGDLFHEDVMDSIIWQIFAIMESTPQHTYQILTKRPARMLELLTLWQDPEFQIRWAPPKNVWLGVTAENQQTADERIPLLLKCPAAMRFVSLEPLLEEIRLASYEPERCYIPIGCCSGYECGCMGKPIWPPPYLDWVIVGGETGPGARPMHPDWVRRIRDDCQDFGTPFFFKSWGDWKNGSDLSSRGKVVLNDGSYGDDAGELGYTSNDSREWHEKNPVVMSKVGKKRAGRELDGRTWEEFPK